jgi:riboflavin kinase / FMN adenylyltransferase
MTATIFRSLEVARGNFGPCALAIGNFDGVHIGHQHLIRQTVQYAQEKNLPAAVMTFDPHPAAIVAPQRLPELIVSLETRLKLLSEAGAERILVLPFTLEVSRMTAEEFVSQILVDALETKAVFVGENFHFGHKQSGTPDTLRSLGQKFGFVPQFLSPVTCRGEVVSSSAIRHHIAAGNMSRATRLLGRWFFAEGPVVSGHGIGSKQTVPTLNLRPVSGQIYPRGVYVTKTLDLASDRHWPSITNVGIRPTFGGDELTIETFLLGPLDGEAPKHIQVQFRRFIRGERQFPDAGALKAQIFADVGRAQAYWRRAASIY